MASIFELAPLEEGGPIARGGFDYQDHVAAAFCLEMLVALPRGNQSEISFKLGSQEQARELMRFTDEQIMQARTFRPECADWLGVFGGNGGLEKIYHISPCQQIVYDWLESDLKEANWWR
jgi:hypothetical protein